jgi:hypothetical protein
VRIQKADNGLYQAKLALAGVDQNELLIESTSGILQGNLSSTSGILQGNINTVSGNVNTVSGNLTTVSGDVSKLLTNSRFQLSSRTAGGSFADFANITVQGAYVQPSASTLSINTENSRNTAIIILFSYSSVYTGARPSCFVEHSFAEPNNWIGIGTLGVIDSGVSYSAIRGTDIQQISTAGELRLRFNVSGAGALTNFRIHSVSVILLKGPPSGSY